MSTIEQFGSETTQVPAIAARGLSARYAGRCGVTALDLDIRAGEVFALVGPNGAGKSTALRVLLGELRPATGSVRVHGLDPRQHADRLRGRIGSLVGELEPLGTLTGRDTLWLCAAVRGRDLEYGEKLAARLGLDLNRPVTELSTGCLRALGVVQALMHDPELVVLDEPMAGLDHTVRDEVYAMLRDVAMRGGTVVLFAHDLDEVTGVADRVAVLRPGHPALTASVTAAGRTGHH
jgi:ABC-2 type transport system ATP-binding protein